jgi:hypothetical protein
MKNSKGAMLTEITFSFRLWSRVPQETIKTTKTIRKALFILIIMEGTNLTHKITKGLDVGNKIICVIFGKTNTGPEDEE